MKLNILGNKKPEEKKTKDEYIYNKSTIGGVDDSKLESKETFQPKIYIGKPNHRSWITLAIIAVLIVGGTFGYYRYFAVPQLEVPEETEIPEIIDRPPEISMIEQVRNMRLPVNLNEDNYIASLNREPNINNVQEIERIISLSTIDQISLEINELLAILSPVEATNTEESTPTAEQSAE